MSSNENAGCWLGLFVILAYAGLVVTIISGWIMNIVKLTNCSFDTINAETALRLVGIFVAPLGVVLGFIPHW